MFTLFGFSVVPECYILIFPKLNFFVSLGTITDPSPAFLHRKHMAKYERQIWKAALGKNAINAELYRWISDRGSSFYNFPGKY